jgi:hypothetical protein
MAVITSIGVNLMQLTRGRGDGGSIDGAGDFNFVRLLLGNVILCWACACLAGYGPFYKSKVGFQPDDIFNIGDVPTATIIDTVSVTVIGLISTSVLLDSAKCTLGC